MDFYNQLLTLNNITSLKLHILHKNSKTNSKDYCIHYENNIGFGL